MNRREARQAYFVSWMRCVLIMVGLLAMCYGAWEIHRGLGIAAGGALWVYLLLPIKNPPRAN